MTTQQKQYYQIQAKEEHQGLAKLTSERQALRPAKFNIPNWGIRNQQRSLYRNIALFTSSTNLFLHLVFPPLWKSPSAAGTRHRTLWEDIFSCILSLLSSWKQGGDFNPWEPQHVLHGFQFGKLHFWFHRAFLGQTCSVGAISIDRHSLFLHVPCISGLNTYKKTLPLFRSHTAVSRKLLPNETLICVSIQTEKPTIS